MRIESVEEARRLDTVPTSSDGLGERGPCADMGVAGLLGKFKGVWLRWPPGDD